MYFIYEFLTAESSLQSHLLWVMALFGILTLVFVGAARTVKNEKGQRDPVLVITAYFLASLFFERVVISVWYQWMIVPEFGHLLPAWLLIRHLSLVFIEFSFYAVFLVLLREPIRKWLKGKLLRWLKDA